MAAKSPQKPLSIHRPIMYLDPHRSLTYLYAYLDDISLLDRLQRELQQGGVLLKSLYSYHQPDRGDYLAVLTLDLTDAAGDHGAAVKRLSALFGVQVIGSNPPEPGLTASVSHTLEVAQKPMAVMAREILGKVFKSYSQAASHDDVYRTGMEMGRLAASAVPPLLNRLGLPLTLDLLRHRVLDFQAFGWAEVRSVRVDDSLHGEVELINTFESLPWEGKASGPTCDFIRGFTTGVFSLACNRELGSAESECQGKGDNVYRIVFRPTTT